MQTSIDYYEGSMVIHNEKALIVVDEQEIGLGKKFELYEDGMWKWGQLLTSQYGLIFLSDEGNSRILTEGRVARIKKDDFLKVIFFYSGVRNLL